MDIADRKLKDKGRHRSILSGWLHYLQLLKRVKLQVEEEQPKTGHLMLSKKLGNNNWFMVQRKSILGSKNERQRSRTKTHVANDMGLCLRMA